MLEFFNSVRDVRFCFYYFDWIGGKGKGADVTSREHSSSGGIKGFSLTSGTVPLSAVVFKG